jgi:adenylate cyclase
MEIRAAMCAPLYHAGRVEGLIYVDTRDADNPFRARDLELLAALGALTAVGILQARLRDEVDREKAISSRLSRYSSPRVVEQIVASLDTPDGTMLAAQREVTALFADLSGFTSLAESREPGDVVGILNRAFERLTSAIFQYDGTLDKFLGDGILAVFGAPVPQADHAERAVRAALLMQQLLAESNLTDAQGQPISMRIGINSGTAVAGDIGSPLRKDYTVVGDMVNVASRLQSSVANPGQIVIGPTTYELCKDAFDCEPLPEIRLKGKQQIVRPYLVIRCRADTMA